MRTNLMFSKGPGLEKGFTVNGSYQFDAQQPAWGWRTQVVLTGAVVLTLTAFNITPEGEEAKALETIYRRAGA